jgi:hypothetical protein
LGLEFDLNSKEVWEFDLKVNDDDLRPNDMLNIRDIIALPLIEISSRDLGVRRN